MKKPRLFRRVALLLMIGAAVSETEAQQAVWDRVPGFDGGCLASVAVHPRTGTLFTTEFDAVFRSTDRGRRWSYALMYLQMPTPLCIDSAGTVFTGTRKGVLYSRDDGDTFEELPGITKQIVALTCSRKSASMFAGTSIASPSGDQLYAATSDGLYSLDIATRAQQLIGVPASSITYVHSAPDGSLYVATNDELFSSADSGRSWNPSGLRMVMSIVEDEARGIVYAGGSGGTHRTTTRGKFWDTVYPGLNTANTLILLPGGGIMAGAATARGLPLGVFYSSDQGAHWERRNRGLSDSAIWCIARNPRSGTIILTTLNGDVFRSTNEGKMWIAAPCSGDLFPAACARRRWNTALRADKKNGIDKVMYAAFTAHPKQYVYVFRSDA